MFRDEHMHLYTIFERAQLLERLGALQWRRFPLDELQKRRAPKTVDALVAEIFYGRGLIPRKWDSSAREVKRVAVKIDNYLYLMRRGGFRRVFKWMSRGHDVDLAIRAQSLDHLIDQIGIKQRLVSLDINDQRVLLRIAHDFCDPVGTALMMQRGQSDLGTPIESRIRDAHIVGRDDNGTQLSGPQASLPNVPQKWFPINMIQWFSWKTRGTPARRDYSDGLIHLPDRE